MEIFKSTMGRILGNLVMIVLCASFKWIPGNYLAFYGVGVLILTISTTIMEGANPLARLILFIIAAGFLLIPSFILNIKTIGLKEDDCKMFPIIFFTINATVLFVSWCYTGAQDSMFSFYGEILGAYYPFLGWVVLRLIFQISKHALSIVFLVIGILVLVVMGIMRLVKGSAFDY